MAQSRVKEVFVLGEGCDTANPMERRNNGGVLRSEPGNVGPNSPYADPLMLEQWQLVFGEVFVQQVQAAAKAGPFSCGRRTGCLYRVSPGGGRGQEAKRRKADHTQPFSSLPGAAAS